MWRKDPDAYSSGITNAAYVIMKRNFAPAATRLKALIAREKTMPAALEEARKNLTNPSPIYTQIAIEQIDGNISFFKNDVPAAFTDVTDAALLAEFKQTNDGGHRCARRLQDLPRRRNCCPKATGSFAFGADTFTQGTRRERDGGPAARSAARDRRGRSAEERSRVPGGGEADRPEEVARTRCWRRSQSDHPPAGKLLETTQDDARLDPRSSSSITTS